MSWNDIFRILKTEKKTDWKLKSVEIKNIAQKLRDGNSISSKELIELKSSFKSTEPFADKRGKPFVLYIEDRSFRRFVRRFVKNSGYKFHFKWCRTLEQMESWGRKSRYKEKRDINNPLFPSANGNSEKLDVCINCLNSFNFSTNRPTVEKFNLIEFFQEYGLQNLERATHQNHEHKYPRNWAKISREYKDSMDWKCEECKKSLLGNKKLLHTHHINGVKDDVRYENLKALCIDCHRLEPMHGHL